MVSGLVAHPVRIGKIALQPSSHCEPRCSGLSRRLAKIMPAMPRYAKPD